jgi:Ser/Thr protein kinase RdoA (MazF antagonist)
MNDLFLSRIEYSGDLKPIVEEVCAKFDLGKLQQYEVLRIGYEDLNVKTVTEKGVYLIKMFGTFRDQANCERYVSIMEKVVNHGVSHPKLFPVKNGAYLYQSNVGVRLCVMEYINGKSFYDLSIWPTFAEATILIKEAAKINSMQFEPEDYYDEWSPVNLVQEFNNKGDLIGEIDRKRIQSFINQFAQIDFNRLSQALAHSDIIRPNVIKAENKLYVIDFSVASQKPRIQELAVLMCGMFFNDRDPSDFGKYYDLILREYTPELSEYEKNTLPLFIKACFAMYVILGTYTKLVLKIDHKENDYWIMCGQKGLEYLENSRVLEKRF